MTYNAADRKSVRAAEKAARVSEALRGSFIRSMMSSVEGRAHAYNQLELANVFRTTFDRDPLQMAFNEGNRNAGLQLLNELMRWCPDQYVLMMRETYDRYNRDDRSTEDRNTSGEFNRGEDPRRDVEGSVDYEYDPGSGLDTESGHW